MVIMQEVELTIGIPDYYRDDQLSEDIDKFIEHLIVESTQLGMSIPYYLLEFCE